MLRTEDVTKRYAGVVAVSDVTVSLPTGQVTGIIGPNGAGKTTLINLIAGQAVPSEGGVFVGTRRSPDIPPSGWHAPASPAPSKTSASSRT